MCTFLLGFHLVFVSIIAATVGDSLTCLSCKDVPIPRDCQYTAKCGPHEVCYTSSHNTTAGSVRYSMGCMDTLQCNGGVKGRSITNLACSECCNGTLCNSGLCGQTGIPLLSSASRGPVCYSCDQQLSPNSCNTIKECSRDEECILQRFESQVGHDILYKSDCVKKSVCAYNLQQYQSVFGKRDSRLLRHDSQHCALKCCESDLCNSDCSGPRVVNMVHGPIATSAPAVKSTQSTTSPAQPSTTTDCHDSLNDCDLYSAHQCSNSWGLQYCQKTCGLCHVALNETCMDKTDCHLYLQYCNGDWGLQNCVRSCNRCQELRTT